MNFQCGQTTSLQSSCCQPQQQQQATPQSTCLKALSVICTQSVQEVAELTIPALDLGIIGTLVPVTFTVNPAGIVLQGTLIAGKIVDTGFVPITITVGLPVPVTLSVNLPFQSETECPGALPGDNLQKTLPIIEGILEPIFTPATTVVAGVVGLGSFTFKVILRTQVTVSREVLIQGVFNVLGDINPDRGVALQPTTPNTTTQTFFGTP